jgi:hypothetical protein
LAGTPPWRLLTAPFRLDGAPIKNIQFVNVCKGGFVAQASKPAWHLLIQEGSDLKPNSFHVLWARLEEAAEKIGFGVILSEAKNLSST